MDRSLGTPASPRNKDVTNQVLASHLIYGSSDNTNPAYSSANRSLNYASGGSIQSPEQDRVSVIPFTLKYNDAVGLFGKENHFVKVSLTIDKNVAFACFEEPGYFCATITEDSGATVGTYESAKINEGADLEPVNTYDPANIIGNRLANVANAYISVDLNNLKTGNKYIDSWFDVRLYNKNREEHPYDKMFVRLNDWFYIGFHARNTRRLPYNVECVIGQEYVSGLAGDTARYVNRS